jgi:cell wall-associated NlpC family hydrolase
MRSGLVVKTGQAGLLPFRRRATAGFTAVAIFVGLASALAAPADAANLAQIRAQVISLQQEATSIAESAQQAGVDMNNLTRKLASVQNQAKADQATVAAYSKTLGSIAADQYKTGGLGQGLQLLFSANPTRYLAEASTLDLITKKKASKLRQYSVAKQRLQATSLVVNDKLALVKAAHAKFVARQEEANRKLAQAKTLLSKLSKEEQARLAALADSQDSADAAYSRKAIANAKIGSGRGAIALRYAIKQIGDRYVFGAAGTTYWDCSGLTLRAFGAAGVSLPHSAAYQFHFGKSVPRGSMAPGDLVFFGRPIRHVGIYLGGGQMVDAPHSGARVRVESFGSRFGSLAFVGARRI